MESNEAEKNEKKMKDDMVVFVRRLSETEQARYKPKLKSIVRLQNKRQRAANARRYAEKSHHDKKHSSKDRDQGDKEKGQENLIQPSYSKEYRRNGRSFVGFGQHRARSFSARSRSLSDEEPCDRCCRRRRRRRSGRRRRRRSCRRRKRRRRSCRRRRRRRRSCRRRRRRRRSCRRRRRRRSCRRRRRRRC